MEDGDARTEFFVAPGVGARATASFVMVRFGTAPLLSSADRGMPTGWVFREVWLGLERVLVKLVDRALDQMVVAVERHA